MKNFWTKNGRVNFLTNLKSVVRDNLVLISPGDLPLVEGPHPHSHLDCLVSRHPGFFCKITSCSVGPKWPRFAKKLFFPGFLLPRCQGWQGQQVYWKAQGRSVSPGAIGQPQHCLQAQLRSAQGSRALHTCPTNCQKIFICDILSLIFFLNNVHRLP